MEIFSFFFFLSQDFLFLFLFFFISVETEYLKAFKDFRYDTVLNFQIKKPMHARLSTPRTSFFFFFQLVQYVKGPKLILLNAFSSSLSKKLT
ncbi:hypothetical protein CROQUDRAFT_630750 [Cronartium quercuum f. sp. fusiforme G11]|uniref:Uncharacterized protein n=1 Tax=Cronartium quercuum f. sp. fusiforme G11 TaxID=708437 RepID=A0A9P6TGP1_9BASI|nr:hypothetical protein CROQUDRAFT_630750 [Cronartium quercuum f. sp. fusiforme G11]